MVYARRVQLCLHDAASRPACSLNDECRPPGSPPHSSFQLLAYSGSLKLLFSHRSEVIMRWPTVPCLCFRASTTCRRPSLGGEQVEQRTTALQSLWSLRWAGGSFKKVKLQLKPGAHLEYFNVSQCFHRSQDCRATFSERRKNDNFWQSSRSHLSPKVKKERTESVLFSYQQNIKGPREHLSES